MSTKRHKVWIISTISIILIMLAIFASITVYVDPFFHYHAPLQSCAYPIDDERYQNDGIIRNFDYDSIITGTSMTENFMKSEADRIFKADFIKIPFSGGFYKEINDNLKKALEIKEIKYVIRSLDYHLLDKDKDAFREDINYPVYLYDANLFNDVNYVLNKSILFNKTLEVIEYTEAGNRTTSFDEYVNWNDSFTFGAEAVLGTYILEEQSVPPKKMTQRERIIILENIQQNVTDLADENLATTFYLFFPPYSICYWDVLKNEGKIDWHIDAEQVAIEEILKHTNIKLYSFSNYFELVCNLDNYKDQAHYGEWVNSWMLEWMQKDEYLLTVDNYQNYIESIRNFYNSYDYSLLHDTEGTN